jgi:hypothetical protein
VSSLGSVPTIKAIPGVLRRGGAEWKRANAYYLSRAGNGETARLKEAGPGQAPSRTRKGHQSRVALSAWGYLERR